MTYPKVSILIPCYNGAKYIGETLDCVFRQTWRQIEVIVVNDGSTDGSVAEIRRWCDPRLILLDGPNRGAAAARNEAFRRSSGDFIQYLDADDMIDANKIERQIRHLAEEPESIASAKWGRFQNDPSEALLAPEDVWQNLEPVDWLVRSRHDGLGMMFPAIWLFSRGIALAAGPWREDLSLADDTEYFTRLILCAKRVLFCEGARCYYRSGIRGSLSGRKSSQAWASEFKVTELCEEYVRAREDSDRVRRAFALAWQHLAHACYPYDCALAEAALARARSLHPVGIRPDGGFRFRVLSRLIGWRAARRLQVVSGRP
jgi:glycosyltransferase involved in cell wall biosynthesis